MTIKATAIKLHWNYFLALEQDLESVSRYIEFAPNNFQTYSIELAHLLFASASEVDVIAKSLCQMLDPGARRRNIDDYRNILIAQIPAIVLERVFVGRYGLSLTPWENWQNANNPDWWTSYNNVKHERNQYFAEATLKNALNSLAGLLVVTFYYYKHHLSAERGKIMNDRDVTGKLQPESNLMRLSEDHYYATFVG